MSCILCREENRNSLTLQRKIQIFSEEGVQLGICSIISKHFWLRPNKDLQPGQEVCLPCWEAVRDFHQFYQRVSVAHNRLELKSVFGTGEDDDPMPLFKSEEVSSAGQLAEELSDKFFVSDVKVEVDDMEFLPQTDMIEDAAPTSGERVTCATDYSRQPGEKEAATADRAASAAKRIKRNRSNPSGDKDGSSSDGEESWTNPEMQERYAVPPKHVVVKPYVGPPTLGIHAETNNDSTTNASSFDFVEDASGDESQMPLILNDEIIDRLNAVEEQLSAKLDRLTMEVISMRDEVSSINSNISSTINETHTKQTIFLKNPFSYVNEFETLEKSLEDEACFDIIVSELQSITENSFEKFIRICWRKIFTDELAQQYTWRGTSSKKCIRNSLVTLAIRTAFKKNFVMDDDDFDKVTQKHFRYTHDRLVKTAKCEAKRIKTTE